jgi:hypothetical protein
VLKHKNVPSYVASAVPNGAKKDILRQQSLLLVPRAAVMS